VAPSADDSLGGDGPSVVAPCVFKLAPGEAIGPVELGMDAETVRGALAPHPGAMSRACVHNGLAYYFDNALQVEFDADGGTCFIGVACHDAFRVMHHGLDLFDTSAEEVFTHFARLSRRATGFDPMEGAFADLGVGFWDADEQYDRYRDETRAVWGQLSVFPPAT